MSEKVLTKIGGINVPRYKLLVKAGSHNPGLKSDPYWNPRDYKLFSGATDGEVLLPRTGYRMLNNLEHKINPYYKFQVSGGRFPDGNYNTIACKESIIDYLLNNKSFTLTLKAPFSKLERSRFEKWIQNKTNITVDNENIVCDGGWWNTAYRLGWLMMGVRIAQGNFSNLTETFIKRFEEFIAGDYSNEVPMTPYQNWETKYNV